MADWTFNISLGIVKYYASLPAANDAIIALFLETTGLEADATLRDYDDLATLLGGASNEQTTLGRKTITSTTPTVDDTNNRLDIDMADLTWLATAGSAVSKLLFLYDPDTTSGTDSTLVPLTAHDCPFTPDGTDFTATIAAAGFYRAAG